ncbi:MAG: hypothetical protein UV63_C0033G0018 [Microgenomates group bacterium GW2011_GWC1_43_11]|uniref:Uncharacterized protein n=2 Tax=Candidatus Gottesmaniibacteriota TaxID=1752720 RepID=A0A0G1INX5_9BACT|nr:MAG: hypothetical protein UV63_C0033G0018 [Microgenomates group bacterium GW2011_GWC1_43_11]KKT38123.1 MAG: hypothetical protein UW22_C0013G0010 [Candidatus Gottesmanbacteria bacterium GW2011_GWB1_44_11c]KKT60860.1 MAG: hypothetical protein UW52_C0016G0007 [Candidatus Gottesmanbacteria bacterium GW2011_GWA1_44_24b]HCM82395.1 hypothetical protein [Patescibacteria group bacterium]
MLGKLKEFLGGCGQKGKEPIETILQDSQLIVEEIIKISRDAYASSVAERERYMKATARLGVADKIIPLPGVSEWGNVGTKILLNESERADFFKEVCAIEDEEGV